ncbi:unnamed protein product [Amoebophrya sp. A120]|nr:unnamed protein product [Amoebophrya sp. A120]|eukprot:GSA120T00022396001.1
MCGSKEQEHDLDRRLPCHNKNDHERAPFPRSFCGKANSFTFRRRSSVVTTIFVILNYAATNAAFVRRLRYKNNSKKYKKEQKHTSSTTGSSTSGSTRTLGRDDDLQIKRKILPPTLSSSTEQGGGRLLKNKATLAGGRSCATTSPEHVEDPPGGRGRDDDGALVSTNSGTGDTAASSFVASRPRKRLHTHSSNEDVVGMNTNTKQLPVASSRRGEGDEPRQEEPGPDSALQMKTSARRSQASVVASTTSTLTRKHRKTTVKEAAQSLSTSSSSSTNTITSPAAFSRTRNDMCPEAFLTKIDGATFSLKNKNGRNDKTLPCWERNFKDAGYSISTNRRCREKCAEYENCDVWSYKKVTKECIIGGGWSRRFREQEFSDNSGDLSCDWERRDNQGEAESGVCHPWATCGFMFSGVENTACGQDEVFLHHHECNLGSTWEKCRVRCCRHKYSSGFYFHDDGTSAGAPPTSGPTKTARIRVLFVGNSLTFGHIAGSGTSHRRSLPRYIQSLAASLGEYLDVDEDTAGGNSVHMSAHNSYLRGKGIDAKRASGRSNSKTESLLDVVHSCKFGPSSLDESDHNHGTALACPQKGLGTDAQMPVDKDDVVLGPQKTEQQFPREDYVKKRYDVVSFQDQSSMLGLASMQEHFYQSSIEFYKRQFPDALLVAHMVQTKRTMADMTSDQEFKPCAGDTDQGRYLACAATDDADFDHYNSYCENTSTPFGGDVQNNPYRAGNDEDKPCRAFPTAGYGKYAVASHACWHYSLFRGAAHALTHGGSVFVPVGLAFHVGRGLKGMLKYKQNGNGGWEETSDSGSGVEGCDEKMDDRYWNDHEKLSGDDWENYHQNGYDHGDTFDLDVNSLRTLAEQEEMAASKFYPPTSDTIAHFRENVLKKSSSVWSDYNYKFSNSNELYTDSIHVTELGQYLAACTWVSVVLKKDLDQLCGQNADDCWRPTVGANPVSWTDAKKVYRIVKRILSSSGSFSDYDPCLTWSNRERCGTVGYSNYPDWQWTHSVDLEDRNDGADTRNKYYHHDHDNCERYGNRN